MTIYKNFLKNGLTIIVIVMVFYVGIILYSDIKDFSDVVSKINYTFLLPIIALMSIHILLLGYRFHRLVLSLGIKIKLKRSILIYFAGLSLTIVPAGIGQILKSHLIKKEYGAEISKTAPIIIVEKWNELISVLIILLFTFFFAQIFEAQIIAIIGIILMLMMALLLKNKTWFKLFEKIVNRIKILNKIKDNLEQSRSSLNIIMSKKMILESIIITTPAKFLEMIAVFFAFLALGVNLDFISTTQIFITSLLSGVISFVPGGFGVTEASMLGLLTKYTSDFTLAAAAVIFVRLMTIWFATILGLITVKIFIKS